MFLPMFFFGQSGNFGEKTGWIYGSDGNGKGKYVWENGDSYVGNYKDGKRNDNGTFTWASGNKYVGEWKDGKLHGQGAMYNSYGTLTKKGKWINDVYQKPKTSNTNTWKPPVKKVCNRKSKLAIAE